MGSSKKHQHRWSIEPYGFHKPEGSSNRSFGIVMGVLALAAAVYFVDWRYPLIGLAVGIFALTWLAPSSLSYLNRLWTGLGLILGRFVSPLIMIGIFALVITPIALFARVMGKDFLNIRNRNAVSTYWHVHDTSKGSFRNQF